MTNTGRVAKDNELKSDDIYHNPGPPTFDRVPQAFWLQRLKRLRDAFRDPETGRGKPIMLPENDWMADIESSIAELERGLGIDRRSTG